MSFVLLAATILFLARPDPSGEGAMKKVLQYAAACVALFVALAPVYWLVTISLSGNRSVRVSSGVDRLVPTLQHYAEAFRGGSFAAYFLNSVLLASMSTVAALILACRRRTHWRGSNGRADRARASRTGSLSTRMLPPIVTIVPLFLMLRQVHLLNRWWGSPSFIRVQSSIRGLDDAQFLRGGAGEIEEPRCSMEKTADSGHCCESCCRCETGIGCDRRILPDRRVERVPVRLDPDPNGNGR